MNDAEYEYAKMLTSMEKEVLDLKTAHLRPLGALNFFYKQETLTIPLTYSYGMYEAEVYIRTSVEPAGAGAPIVQIGWDRIDHVMSELFDFTISGDYSSWTYRVWIYSNSANSVNLPVSVISSQPINSISWENV